MSSAGCQLEEAFLLKVLRQVIDQHILQKDQVQDDLEGHLEALWDLSVETEAAEAIQHFEGISIFAQAAERSNFEGHLAEIFLGILANVCTHLSPTTLLQPEDMSFALRALRTSDGLVLVQALRISCSLLCGKMFLSLVWSPTAIDCYIFALEHSLRWDVVRYACDALCQGLVLEMTTNEDAASNSMLRGSPSRTRLPHVLEQRCRELCVDEESLEEGADVETALWSALRLAESLACLDAEGDALHSTALMAIDRVEKPDLLVAALEVLSELWKVSDQSQQVPCGKTGEVVVLMAKSEVVEKLLFLLGDLGEETSDVLSVAWILLQHADRAELQKHLEVIEEARAAIHQELREQLSPDFMRFLDSMSQVSEWSTDSPTPADLRLEKNLKGRIIEMGMS